MAGVVHKIGIVPSILDRLLDAEPGNAREPLADRFQSLRELEAVVARDLELLLNTKRESLAELPTEFAEVNRSLVTYGLPDFTDFSLDSIDDRSRILRTVEQVIADFEPRLQNVHVAIEPPRPHDRGLRFRIDALLRVDPAPQPVTFDAVLRLITKDYQISGRG